MSWQKFDTFLMKLCETTLPSYTYISFFCLSSLKLGVARLFIFIFWHKLFLYLLENVPWSSSGDEWVWNEDDEEDGLAGGATTGKDGRGIFRTYCHGCQGGSQW